MNEYKSAVENYLAAFRVFEENLNGAKEQPLHQLRKQAIDKFIEVGFPEKNNEEWRFTNLKPLLEHNFIQSSVKEVPVSVRKLIDESLFENWNGVQLVFVDGFFQEEFSQMPALPTGVTVQSLSSMQEDEQITDLLEKELTSEKDAFKLLNAAFVQDGLYINIGNNVHLSEPVHILLVQTAQQDTPFRTTKNILKVGKNSVVKCIESQVSEPESVYFANHSVSVQVADNAQVDYYKLQNESRKSYHISNMNVEMARDSRFKTHSLDFGGRLVRNNIEAYLLGEGCEATLNGLYLGSGEQHIDNHTVLQHASAHCDSHELYQGILGGKSRGVFSGMIHVHPDAQKTDAKQSNNCLLLSDEAKIDAKPQLEIYADDVKCTHGATVGQLDEEGIFYLQSRGISRGMARQMLTYAFAEKIIEHVDVPELNTRVEKIFLDKFNNEIMK